MPAASRATSGPAISPRNLNNGCDVQSTTVRGMTGTAEVSQAEHEAFFEQMLGDVSESTPVFEVVEAPGDCAVHQSRLIVEPDLAPRIRACAEALGVSAASVYHLAWAQVLARISARSDVVFGVALRAADASTTVLPLRVRIDEEGVATSVLVVHRLLAQLARHDHASLVLAQRRSGVATPTLLFSALLDFAHSAETEDEGIGNITTAGGRAYPLMISIRERRDELVLAVWVVDVAGVEPQRICQWTETALRGLVGALEDTPLMAARGIDILSTAERRQLIEGWNTTQRAYASAPCVHESFEAQVVRTPHDPAFVFEGAHLTYLALNAQANRLAHTLLACGVSRGAYVPVVTERGTAIVVAMLGIMKSGAAFVPLDRHWPRERLTSMLRDLSAPVVLCDHPELIDPPLDHPHVIRIGDIIAMTTEQDGSRNPRVRVDGHDPI
jgi:non-ribosomal peptide synthetase component F